MAGKHLQAGPLPAHHGDALADGQARADAAIQLAQAIEAHPAAAESLRLLLAKDWIAMGEQLSKAPGGSVLLVDPQSPAALLTALQGLQGQKG